MTSFDKSCVMLVAIVGAVLCLSSAVQGLGTVYDIDVDKYVGKYYNMYSNFWSDLFAEMKGAECTTATYGKISDLNVTVVNAYNIRTGRADIIGGYAWIPFPIEPGKLMVKLDGVPIAAPYWIIKLGPIVDDKYEYSIVTDSASLSLFVLARDPETFATMYDAEVREYLSVTGFTTPNTEPISVYHGDDCEYL